MADDAAPIKIIERVGMTTHRILVFSDERHTSQIIRWVLEYKGYWVRSAVGLEAAIEALVKKNYGLVLAKFSSGAIDNVRLLRRTKQLNPEMKIILMGHKQNPAFPWEAYRIEVDDYLLMPISPIELWHRVNRCLEPALDLRLGETTEDGFISLTRRGENFAQEIPVG